MLCFAGALHAGTEVAPLLSKMDSCQFYPVEHSCKCFHQSELRQVSIIFRDTANCNGIQIKLRDLVYGMSGVYGGGWITCIVAAVMETMLLCRKQRSKVCRPKAHSFCYELLPVFQSHLIAHFLWELTKVKDCQGSQIFSNLQKWKKNKINENKNIYIS